MNKNRFIISIIILFIDQLIKLIIQNNNINIINKYISIIYVKNTGAAFSILSGNNSLLIVLSIIIFILIYYLSNNYHDILSDIDFGLIYGGLFGNLLDRIIYGYVRDYISILSFPIFNIADMGIVIGITLLTIYEIKEEKNNANNSKR